MQRETESSGKIARIDVVPHHSATGGLTTSSCRTFVVLRIRRTRDDFELSYAPFVVTGRDDAEFARNMKATKERIAFYGSTPNYAFQFDDLGFEGTTAKLGALMKQGDTAGMADTISDEMLEHFALVARWDDMADALLGRYQGVAARVVTYLASEDVRRNPGNLGRWGEIARAVRAA